MIDHDSASVGIRVEGVGVVAQARDGDAGLGGHFLDTRCLLSIEGGHIDMRHTGVSSARSPGGPTHQLDATESFVGRKFENFFKR